jgi:hypothetical protein
LLPQIRYLDLSQPGQIWNLCGEIKHGSRIQWLVNNVKALKTKA